ncbi:MAG: tRNA lysidine(34) synthetase TilS [Gemmatimonadetes bacterium]|nr:tRNA lysidine(34) synthetase TilS [Gemmatimonadota bacterium]
MKGVAMLGLPARLLAHIREADLLPRPGLALLAVSGGEDSLTLLDVFSVIASDLGLTLAVAHVDHGISPASADVAEQVLALAVRYRVPGHLISLALGPDASETRARQERYRALRHMQRSLAADYLVTAHQADDQIETVLYRMLRGSAPAGLAGIPPRGPSGLVRPLLPFRRAELSAWLSRPTSLVPRHLVHHDPSNRDERHDRSWLRARVLPLFRERFGDRVERNLLSVQQSAAQDRAAWSALLRTLPGLDFRRLDHGVEVARGPLQTYDKTLSEALLRALAREAGCTVGPRRAARVRVFLAQAGSGHAMELGGGWVAEVAFDRVGIHMEGTAVPSSETWGVGERGSTRWGSWEIAWRREPAGESARRGLTAWMTARPGEVRAVQQGDRVFPLGGTGHRPVRRLLMEARVPRSERVRYPVLVRGEEILWVPGVCRGAAEVPAPGDVALRVEARPVPAPPAGR